MSHTKQHTNFICNLAAKPSRLNHVWEHMVGSGHALLALRADWQVQLKKAHDELGFSYVRFHGILDDDVGTLTCQEDKLIYSFFNSDQILDFLLSIGMKPFVELSFMPLALASGDATVFKYKGNVTPPRDYSSWETLIKRLVNHWVERYGVNEVRQWFFEVWNEPNLKAFWVAEQADYFKLYKHTVRAIKSIDSKLKVGGPATAKNAWITDFLVFCASNDLPADFVSTHHYPTDAFGQPGDDTETQLSKSHRSVLREEACETYLQAQNKPVYYTEWCTSSNPFDILHDESYAAAFIIKTNMEAVGLMQGYSYWTFSDIFEENYFSSVPFHGGFGLLNIHGIAKPAYRAYQLLRQLGTDQLPVEGSHTTVDVWVVRRKNDIMVLATNWGLPRHHIRSESIFLSLNHSNPPFSVDITRIDSENANAKSAWIAMGEPEYLSAEQIRHLHAASELKSHDLPYEFVDNTIILRFILPPQSVVSLNLKFQPFHAAPFIPQKT
ncbi:GH39 family glycosyl hydrolase [Nitrosomonas supralitoralis]|uniref:Beta-xylosidase n=1 Tax=Nitrosomonas supralitoralis TaxID=2116706 RepID=A0A2P7NSW2_9PROT|nr:cellulase family glycosylhydrolase [Nitrosomonas supralitoralis]PSJ16518.1 beta-xylosidase [Nitrosomonas supralitoralis]